MESTSRTPISVGIDVLADRWSLLILRDVVFGDRRYFRALLGASEEGIASNILADRLVRLVDAGLLVRGTAARGQRARYSLTEAGIQTLPVLVALGDWALDWRYGDADSPTQQHLIREGGRELLEELMADLRTRHLSDPTDADDASPFERLAPERSPVKSD